MTDVTITVPQDIVQALRLPPDTVAAELQRELAVALYQRGILSSGKAAALAGMTLWEGSLRARKIPRHYADEEFTHAFGEKADPRAIELLSPFFAHQDMDFRRYAREAIEFIHSHRERQNFAQPR